MLRMEGNSALKSYSGVSELEKKSVGFKEALETQLKHQMVRKLHPPPVERKA